MTTFSTSVACPCGAEHSFEASATYTLDDPRDQEDFREAGRSSARSAGWSGDAAETMRCPKCPAHDSGNPTENPFAVDQDHWKAHIAAAIERGDPEPKVPTFEEIQKRYPEWKPETIEGVIADQTAVREEWRRQVAVNCKGCVAEQAAAAVVPSTLPPPVDAVDPPVDPTDPPVDPPTSSPDHE